MNTILMKKNKGRPRVTKCRMMDPLEEIPVHRDITYDAFRAVAKVDDKVNPDLYFELEAKFEELAFADIKKNESGGRPDYNESEWANEQIIKSIHKEFNRKNIKKSKQDVEDLASAVWCRLLINSDYDYMEQKSHKGQKIKTMVHNQMIDENRKVQPDFSKEVHNSGMYEDLIFNGIKTKSQINSFIQAFIDRKPIYFLKDSSSSGKVIALDLKSLWSSEYLKILTVRNNKTEREPFLFPRLKEGSYKKLSNDEIKNYIPSKKIKKARGDDVIIKTTKGQYRQSIPDAEED